MSEFNFALKDSLILEIILLFEGIPKLCLTTKLGYRLKVSGVRLNSDNPIKSEYPYYNSLQIWSNQLRLVTDAVLFIFSIIKGIFVLLALTI